MDPGDLGFVMDHEDDRVGRGTRFWEVIVVNSSRRLGERTID